MICIYIYIKIYTVHTYYVNYVSVILNINYRNITYLLNIREYFFLLLSTTHPYSFSPSFFKFSLFYFSHPLFFLCAVEEEDKMTPEQLAIKNVGKQDPKRHLEEHVDVLMTSNIVQCLAAMLDTVVFQ
uniref:26S proteasome regulatory subunit RPN11 C-terminal domain-containing protein n=1 Tax=Sinocyclocheilus anshuiensis TaxID=1608454 RepID=A0A671MXY3_9TELE